MEQYLYKLINKLSKLNLDTTSVKKLLSIYTLNPQYINQFKQHIEILENLVGKIVDPSIDDVTSIELLLNQIDKKLSSMPITQDAKKETNLDNKILLDKLSELTEEIKNLKNNNTAPNYQSPDNTNIKIDNINGPKPVFIQPNIKETNVISKNIDVIETSQGNMADKLKKLKSLKS